MTTVLDPFEEINTPAGRMERWRANAMLIGETSALLHVRRQVRNDAVGVFDEIEQREQAVAEREARCDARDRAFRDATAKFFDRAAPFVDRAEQARADQERQQEEPLPAPPSNPDEPPPGSEGDDTHVPTGELHAVAASTPQHEEQLPAPPSEPPADAALSGDPSPPSVPLSYVHSNKPSSRDQAEFPDPELPKPPVTAQPISVGLDGD